MEAFTQNTRSILRERRSLNKYNHPRNDTLTSLEVMLSLLWSPVGRCWQNRGFLWLSKIYGPRFIGTRERTHCFSLASNSASPFLSAQPCQLITFLLYVLVLCSSLFLLEDVKTPPTRFHLLDPDLVPSSQFLGM